MRTNVKNIINYENKTRQCGICKVIKPFSDYTLEGPKKRPKSYCKPCHSSSKILTNIIKASEKFPYRYHQCDDDDCCKIWHKRAGNFCPKCGKGAEEK